MAKGYPAWNKGKKTGQIPWNKGKKCPPTEKALAHLKDLHEKLRGRPSGRKGEKMPQITGDKNPMYGKHPSEETRRKQSIARKGRSKTEEHKRKISESNIGKHNQTEEQRKHNSEAHKGYIPTEETRRKIGDSVRGEKNGNYGKSKTPEIKSKISKAHIGKKLTEEHKKKIGEGSKGKLAGIKHWNCDKEYLMTHGTLKSYAPYCYKFNKRRKRAVREFFNYMCICTGEKESDLNYILSVHHTYHDREEGCNGKPFNLVPMIRSYNSKEVHNQKEYQDYINKTLREGFKWGIWNEQEYMEKVMYDEE